MKIIYSIATFAFFSLIHVQAETITIDRGFADLVKKIGPGVVNISTFARPELQQQGPGYNEDLFRRFFDEYFGGRGPGGPQGNNGPDGGDLGPGPFGDENQEPKAPRARPGKGARGARVQPLALGTGFIIDAAEGLILTNYHVVDKSEEVKIQLEEESDLLPAEVIGRDPELDVALLKLKTKIKLLAMPLGDSDKIDVGEYVLAIGNPLGYGHTVSHGILSAKGRKNPEFRLGRYLQTDASINPGNSGGPLVNMKGEVVGINNAIDARAQGIGFAIPINLIKAVLPQLKSKGTVSRGYLGVSAGDINAEIAEQMHLGAKVKGVLVADVGKGTPAAKAGIKPYDVITAVNGGKVLDSQDLTAKVTAVPVGSTASITLLRGGKEKVIPVVIAERPVLGMSPPLGGGGKKEEKGVAKSAEFKDFGFTVAELGADAGREFSIPPSAFKGKRLLVVVEVDEAMGAAASGLNAGDVILDVGNKEVRSVNELKASLKGKTKSVLVRVKRFNNQGEGYVSVVVLTK